MNTPRNTPITTALDLVSRPSVADRVAAATADYRHQFHTVAATSPVNDLDRARRAEQLAMICARSAGWWRVLTTGTRGDLDLHPVYRRAAIAAECRERDQARFWRDTAADWRARAEQRPTSDAAGALSNWAELGVSA